MKQLTDYGKVLALMLGSVLTCSDILTQLMERSVCVTLVSPTAQQSTDHPFYIHQRLIIPLQKRNQRHQVLFSLRNRWRTTKRGDYAHQAGEL